MKMEGYHNTEASNVEDILQNGFIYTPSDEHWLGQGIYFFADIDTAAANIDMLHHNDEIKTIAVEIDAEDARILDLDIKENLNSFRKYCNDKSNFFKECGKELVIHEPNPQKAMLKYRCFFMDLYKLENEYAVVTKTFAKDKPPYAVPVANIKYFGLPFLEKYICVSDNQYIVKKNLIEREWLV